MALEAGRYVWLSGSPVCFAFGISKQCMISSSRKLTREEATVDFSNKWNLLYLITGVLRDHTASLHSGENDRPVHSLKTNIGLKEVCKCNLQCKCEINRLQTNKNKRPFIASGAYFIRLP